MIGKNAEKQLLMHLIQSAHYNHFFKTMHIFKHEGMVTLGNFYFLPHS